MTGHVLIFGFGYVAEAIARRLRPLGWRISASARRLDKAGELATRGIPATVFHEKHGLTDFARALDGVTHVIVTAPPGEAGDPVLAAHAADFERLSNPPFIAYLSTTGVYGDAGGKWVDEGAPIQPVHARGERRMLAEIAWAELGETSGATVTFFRLPGIYGPGRSAFDALRAGTARRLVKPGQVFSRIHVDDIAQLLEAAFGAGLEGGTVLNLADDEPAPPQDVVTEAARLLGVAPPPEQDYETAKAALSPMAQEFYGANRRISNKLMKRMLGVPLIYPTYREGLRGILAVETGNPA